MAGPRSLTSPLSWRKIVLPETKVSTWAQCVCGWPLCTERSSRCGRLSALQHFSSRKDALLKCFLNGQLTLQAGRLALGRESNSFFEKMSASLYITVKFQHWVRHTENEWLKSCPHSQRAHRLAAKDRYASLQERSSMTVARVRALDTSSDHTSSLY